jgi:hypothetical protein
MRSALHFEKIKYKEHSCFAFSHDNKRNQSVEYSQQQFWVWLLSLLLRLCSFMTATRTEFPSHTHTLTPNAKQIFIFN